MTAKEPVGTVAEEAAKLFAVLRAAGAADFGAAAGAGAGGDAAGEAAEAEAGPESAGPEDHPPHGIGHGPECQWCPLCQVINRVRTTSPETVEQLSSAAAGVLGAVRGLVEAAAEAARQAKVDAESRAAGEQDRQRPARSRVDRIDVSEDPEPWD
ncbi:hypothetical protein BWI15_24980 [Kribbella sp. ALI-6-A]|uniref:hypothetical protein n=1 Tax=Kribbella sp. ALI-6-A TaxID=1933817 RepID=UPI00097C72A8|nr:hypothetical protein [Kribbella sp. ALI-6-A]ONI69791.1 hypothetical protein BWI15_24980 [Kribbella sp. ALI-6-A]